MITWEVEQTFVLTAQLRTFLTNRYGYTAPAPHTRGFIISIQLTTPIESRVITEYATSVDDSGGFDGGAFWAAQNTASRTAFQTALAALSPAAVRALFQRTRFEV